MSVLKMSDLRQNELYSSIFLCDFTIKCSKRNHISDVVEISHYNNRIDIEEKWTDKFCRLCGENIQTDNHSKREDIDHADLDIVDTPAMNNSILSIPARQRKTYFKLDITSGCKIIEIDK